jgi:hypothetical protein
MPQIQQLAQGLRDAVRAQDWAALTRYDQVVSALLSELVDHGALLSSTERTALADLALAHKQGRVECANATELLSRHIDHLLSNKDGWLAYALNSDLNETEI